MSSTEAIAPTGASTPAGTVPSGVENPGAVLDRDAFLKLLVAQLKYQDPTKPADSSQMLAQSAQLTMVDRLNEIAESFETAGTTQRLSLAGTLVGRDITFVGPDGHEQTATVSSARVEADGLVLVAGPYEVPYDAITAVLAPTPAVATPAAAAPSDTSTDTGATRAPAAPVGTASDTAALDTRPSDTAPVDPEPVEPAPSDTAPVDPEPVEPAPSDTAPGSSEAGVVSAEVGAVGGADDPTAPDVVA